MLAAACSTEINGQATAVEVPQASLADLVNQSLRDLGEAAAVHYRGTLVAAGGEQVGFDLVAAMTGEIAGSVSINDSPASLLLIGRTLYLNAPAEFWAALRGLGNADGKGAALAGRWVKLPSVLLGVEFGEVFTPELISQSLAIEATAEQGGPTDGERSVVGGIAVVTASVKNGTAYLAAQAPHGIVKLNLSRYGSSDTTKVSQLVTEVADASAQAPSFYQDIANRAVGLDSAIDGLTTVRQGPHRFDSCVEASCSLIVEFTNTSKVPVRVQVRADWSADSTPLGTCEAQVGPVAPGAGGAATCTLNSPAWVEFYRKAHAVSGNHPYSAEWSTVVLADPPDLAPLVRHAAAKPADPAIRKAEGSHYVYQITYADQVWKYGIAAGKYWRDHAAQQARTCLAVTRAMCFVSLVTAVDEAASGMALHSQLVQTYRSRTGRCPSGQWVGCPP